MEDTIICATRVQKTAIDKDCDNQMTKLSILFQLYVFYLMTAINTCAPFLQEKCLMAPTVTSKTVKILNGPAIQKAIEENPNVHFIHAVSINYFNYQ